MRLSTSALALEISADGLAVRIEDRQRRITWTIDPATRRYYVGDSVVPLPAGSVEAAGDAIVSRHAVGGGAIAFTWRVADDHVAVSMACESREVTRVALPGAAVAESASEIAVPIYQGLLLRTKGQKWERSVPPGGHGGAAMAMAAVLGERGGLLITHENHANWVLTYGDSPAGVRCFFEQARAPVDGWTGATVRLYPGGTGLVAATERYRAIVKERGWFRPWSEKIARKPALKQLFGGLMTFIGYMRADDVDYVASARRLREMGFPSVFLYPVRMAQYSLDFKMGGSAPIWLSDETIARLRAIDGVYVAPWSWVFEGIDDGTPARRAIFRHDEKGPRANWSIDNHTWYMVCPPYQIEHIKQRLAGDLGAMDWLHYDVTCSISPQPCLAGHAAHGSRPMGPLEEGHWNRRLLDVETNGNRIISAEGFRDFFAGSYDIGTVKMLPPEESDGSAVPVPLTMLVYHDCLVHDWWEMHNYNENPGWKIGEAGGIGRTGSGLPRLKAAIDALYGCPPNVFPFGRQYAWVDKVLGETYPFTMSLEDPGVQEALAAALPVARLHQRIGMCAMTGFELLSQDRLVQRTTFSNGTRVLANLSARQVETDTGPLAAHSWREVLMDG